MLKKAVLWIFKPEVMFSRGVSGREAFLYFSGAVALEVLLSGIHQPMGLPDFILRWITNFVLILLFLLLMFPLSHLIASFLGEDEPPLSESFKNALSFYGVSWMAFFPVVVGFSFLHPAFGLLPFGVFIYLLIKYFMWAYDVSIAGALIAAVLPPAVVLLYMLVMAYHIWVLRWTLFS